MRLESGTLRMRNDKGDRYGRSETEGNSTQLGDHERGLFYILLRLSVAFLWHWGWRSRRSDVSCL